MNEWIFLLLLKYKLNKSVKESIMNHVNTFVVLCQININEILRYWWNHLSSIANITHFNLYECKIERREENQWLQIQIFREKWLY